MMPENESQRAAPPRCLFTLVCDDVRREDTGKLLFVGVYLPDILVPHVPFVFPQIVFFQLFEWLSVGRHTIRGSLHCLTSEGIAQVAGISSHVEITQPGIAPHFFRFNHFTVERPGEYVFRLCSEGQQDPFLEHRFQVYVASR